MLTGGNVTGGGGTGTGSGGGGGGVGSGGTGTETGRLEPTVVTGSPPVVPGEPLGGGVDRS